MTDYDKQRDTAIYRYLLCLATITNDTGKPNYRQTAKRLGKDNADYAIRIYNDVHGKEQKYGAARLSAGTIVDLLSELRRYPKFWQSKDFRIEQYITEEDILKIFQKLTQLAPEEKRKLGLVNVTEDIILQQSLVNLGVYHNALNQKKILELYKISITTPQELSNSLCDNQEKIIEDTIQELLHDLPNKFSYYYFDKFFSQAIRVINKLKFQAGIAETEINKIAFLQKFHRRFSENYLSPDLIKQITKTVITNNILNETYPIYIKDFKIDKLLPLPLFLEGESESYDNYLLNKTIKDIEGDGYSEVQEAYEITIYFYVKLPRDYQPIYEEVYSHLTDGNERLSFSVSSAGVSGTGSLCIMAINRALLWNLGCLKEYFPVAHDLIINQEVIGNQVSSIVRSHNLIRLSKVTTLKAALIENLLRQDQENCVPYEQFSFLDAVGTGDFYSFDCMEALMKSAVQARLKAIYEAGVDPQKYIEELCNRVEKLEQFKTAKKYLKFYPFSLRAVESYLGRSNGLLSQEPSCLVEYNAYLLVIEKYLNEGLYRHAYSYLNKLSQLENFQKHTEMINFEQSSTDGELQQIRESFPVFSGSILATYQLCKAYYFYLLDCEKESDTKYRMNLTMSTRYSCIVEALRHLDKAEHNLRIRTAKYFIINEISQSVLYPHFYLLSKISFLKAKIFIFFPHEAGVITDDTNKLKKIHYARISLLEKSRIYAARNGETELYSISAAYQSWVYTMAGYLVDKEIVVDKHRLNLKKAVCLEWGRKLVNHSLLTYAEIGKNSYDSVKENSGLNSGEQKQQKPRQRKDGRYGNIVIKPIPPIKELMLSIPNLEEANAIRANQGVRPKEGDILNIDMSLLSLPESNIYLFGVNACYLLFARGMQTLCNDQPEDSGNEQDWEKLQTISGWEQKIFRAYRLFIFAWATADDGGKTQRDNIIARDFVYPDSEDQHLPPEVKSVRDLYPYRISEIVDMSRIYAAACNLILLSLVVKESIRESLTEEIIYLIDSLHGDIHKSIHEEDVLKEQNRVNGHLSGYLKTIDNWLKSELTSSRIEVKSNVEMIKQRRDEVVMKMFKSLEEQ